MDQKPKPRKPKGKARVPDHLRPVLASIRIPREDAAWIDRQGGNRTAVIIGLIRKARGAK